MMKAKIGSRVVFKKFGESLSGIVVDIKSPFLIVDVDGDRYSVRNFVLVHD